MSEKEDVAGATTPWKHAQRPGAVPDGRRKVVWMRLGAQMGRTGKNDIRSVRLTRTAGMRGADFKAA